jgi:hypothetical protein
MLHLLTLLQVLGVAACCRGCSQHKAVGPRRQPQPEDIRTRPCYHAGNDGYQRRCCPAAVLHVHWVFAEEDEERALVLGADQGRVWSAERFRRSQDLVCTGILTMTLHVSHVCDT